MSQLALPACGTFVPQKRWRSNVESYGSAAHGGAVLVESAPGEGSCFSLLLPAPSQATTSPPEPSPSAEAAPCHVLVVDDEALVRDQLARLLSLRGFQVHAADGGQAALTLLPQLKPELVILDLKMPGLDGIEVARRIREHDRTVPILLSSGYFDPSAEQELDDGLIQGFLPKPYNLHALLRAVAAARERA